MVVIPAIDKLIDDPVGALSAHGIAGIWGTLSCGIFTAPRLAEYNAFGVTLRREFIGGFLYSSGLLGKGANDLGGSFNLEAFEQLGAQALGVVVAFSFVFAASFATFYVIKKIYGLRVTESEEDAGLDIAEHGMYGYPEQFIPQGEFPGARPRPLRLRLRLPSHPNPARHRRDSRDEEDRSIHPTRGVRADPVRLLDRGFPSLSISEVKGSGRQKGVVEHYRGSTLTVNVRPKMKIECVVEDKDKGSSSRRSSRPGRAMSATARSSSSRSMRRFAFAPARRARPCCRLTRKRRFPPAAAWEQPGPAGRPAPACPFRQEPRMSMRELGTRMIEALLAGYAGCGAGSASVRSTVSAGAF